MTHSLEFMRFCVYTWLTDIRFHWREIENLEEKIQLLRHRLDGLSSASGESVKGGRAYDKLADGIHRLEELSEYWEQSIALYSDEYVHAMEVCSADVNTKAVWMHIVERKTWVQVGKHMGYSESQIKRMRDTGIIAIYETMPGDYRGYSIPSAI